MKVRVLGCSGAIAKDCRTTSFLIDDNILVDAGTGVGDLTLEEMCKIDHVFLTHSHLDHIAALPLMLDAVSSLRSSPVQVHALVDTIAALQAHVFNNVIWPDFSSIPTLDKPFLQYQPVSVGDRLHVMGVDMRVLPAVHTVSSVGYAVAGQTGWWVFSGDTGRNADFWECINTMRVAMLVIETAFSNRETCLAQRSLHLSPRLLAQELVQLPPGNRYPIYITHTKPSEIELIMEEIRAFSQIGETQDAALYNIHWLRTGDVFEV